MRTCSFSRTWQAAVGALLLAACAGEDTLTPNRSEEIPQPGRPSYSILDAVHNQGNSHFFLLPPLVPAPTVSGTFDPAQRPLVRICELAGTLCTPVVADFLLDQGTGSETIRVDAAAEHYVVNWKTTECVTGPCTLDPAKIYRIQVMVGAVELGHADVQVVSNGSQLKNVNTNEYVGLVDGRTLPIKFRIEAGAAAVVEKGAPTSVGVDGGMLALADGKVSLEIPQGALSATTPITIESATNTPPVGAWSEPVDLGPDGTTFAEPVILTLGFDPTLLPEGVPPEAVTMYTSDGTGWVPVEDALVNPGDNTVSAPISHFSTYWIGIRPNTISGPTGVNLYVGQSTTFTATVLFQTSTGQIVCYNVYDQYGRFVRRNCYTVQNYFTYFLSGVAVYWQTGAPAIATVAAGPTYTNTRSEAISPPVQGVAPGATQVTARTADLVSSPWPITVTVPPDPVFVLVRTVNGTSRNLYTMTRDGLIVRQLTFNGLNSGSTEPAVSPDGTSIAFRGPGGQIELINVDGSGRRQLTTCGSFNAGPSWSPDGRKIVYHGNCNGPFSLWVMNEDGTGQAPLAVPGNAFGYAGWSPDGEWIAFQSDAAGSGLDIWIIRPDGTGARRASTGPASDELPQWSPDARHIVHHCGIDLCVTDAIDATTRVLVSNGFRNEAPKWSRDGTTISFGSTAGGGVENIWTVAADGSAPPVRVTNYAEPEGHPTWLGPAAPAPPPAFLFLRLFGPVADIYTVSREGTYPRRIFGDGSQNQDLTISVDGRRRILFRDASSQIRSMAFDGTDLRTLTSCGFNSGPHWSPDGARITFYSDCTGPAITVMNADGSGRMPLTNPPVNGGAPAWSPDGQWIAFYSNRNGPYDIWVMRPDGGDIRQLTFTAELDALPIWSPDGTKLVYNCGPDICTLEVATAVAQRVLLGARTARWSADGSMLVFSAGIEGRANLFEARADGSGPRRRLTIHSAGDEGAVVPIP